MKKTNITYYVFSLSLRSLLFCIINKKVYFFSTDKDNSFAIIILKRLSPLWSRFSKWIHEPSSYLGDHHGLYFQVQKDALECTDTVYRELDLETCLFISKYNMMFHTNKMGPFVQRSLADYILQLLKCLYRVHYDDSSQKMILLRDTPVNRLVFSWWDRKIPNTIQVKWNKTSKILAVIEALISICALWIYQIFSRGISFRVKIYNCRIIKESTWGLRRRLFRDDFFIDNNTLGTNDLLLYTTGTSERSRLHAYADAQDSEYKTTNLKNLKMSFGLIVIRMFKYHLLLPISLTVRSISRNEAYMLREFLTTFHRAAIPYEVLFTHYRFRVELSGKEATVTHIPETIIMNLYGAKSVLWHWSDHTTFSDVSLKFKCHNTYLVWGKITHSFNSEVLLQDRIMKTDFVGKVIETGLIFNENFSKLSRNKHDTFKRFGLSINDRRVVVFYDESFNPHSIYPIQDFFDYWQMIHEFILERTDVIVIMKSKKGSADFAKMPDGGKQISSIKQQCIETGRFYHIDYPFEFDITDVLPLSDINISMGMCSPSTLAILCGKIGLYYDMTGNDQHPFAQKYKNILVFDNKNNLLSLMNHILDNNYNPLKEIDPDLLRQYDPFQDEKGLQRFREALVKESITKIPPKDSAQLN